MLSSGPGFRPAMQSHGSHSSPLASILRIRESRGVDDVAALCQYAQSAFLVNGNPERGRAVQLVYRYGQVRLRVPADPLHHGLVPTASGPVRAWNLAFRRAASRAGKAVHHAVAGEASSRSPHAKIG